LKQGDVQNVLVIGVDATALATSAKKAGYTVFAVDYFGDQDLRQACKNNLSIVEQKAGKSCGRLETNFSPNTLLDLAKQLLVTHQIDAALLASGLEDSPQVLAELNELVPIVGNSPAVIAKVRGKLKFFNELEKLAIPHPKTMLAKNLEEGKQAAKDISYPVIVKPKTGFGGAGIRKAQDESKLETVFQQIISSSPEGVLIQEFVPGLDASVSFLSSKDATTVLTLNEQLLGTQEVGQKEPFGYCGNIVPASTDNMLLEACRGLVQKIASHFRLLGSNGVDLVISKDCVPYVVEVNPRFQGTLECVERVLGLTLVNAHVKACIEGKLPFSERKPTNYCARLILYARQRSIAHNLRNHGEVRDIPFSGVIIEEGEPLCSIVIEEKTRNSALRKAKMLAERVYKMTKPKP